MLQFECKGTEEETGEEGSCKFDQVLFRFRFQNLVNPDNDNVFGRETGGEVFECARLDSTDTLALSPRNPLFEALDALYILCWLLVESDSFDLPFTLQMQDEAELTKEDVIDSSDKIELSRVLNPSCHGKNGSSSLLMSSISQDVTELVFTCLGCLS